MAFIICKVEAVDEGSEVEESRGGLGSFETVSYVLTLFVLGLDSELEGVLLAIELLQVSDGIAVGMEVGGQSPVVLLIGVVDEGVGMRRLTVEEFDKPWG